MKITKSQLQKIIKEETKKVLLEQAGIIPDPERPHERHRLDRIHEVPIIKERN